MSQAAASKVVQLNFTEDEWAQVQSAADAHDVAPGPFVRALALGAIRKGQTTSLLEAVHMDTRLKRRALRRRFEWVKQPDGSWAYGAFRVQWTSPRGKSSLVRQPDPEDHYRMFGPGLPVRGAPLDRRYQGYAEREANEALGRLDDSSHLLNPDLEPTLGWPREPELWKYEPFVILRSAHKIEYAFYGSDPAQPHKHVHVSLVWADPNIDDVTLYAEERTGARVDTVLYATGPNGISEKHAAELFTTFEHWTDA